MLADRSEGEETTYLVEHGRTSASRLEEVWEVWEGLGDSNYVSSTVYHLNNNSRCAVLGMEGGEL